MVRCAHALKQLGARQIVLLHALGLRHLPDMAPRLQEQAEPRIQEQASSLRAQGFEVTPEVAPGAAIHEVVSRCARGGDCSLIVMAATSDSVVRTVVLGSTTTHVLHDATCPVLVLHLKPRQEGDGDRCEVVCGELLRHVAFATDFSDAAEPRSK